MNFGILFFFLSIPFLQATELTPAQREQLKRGWELKQDSQNYQWTYEKRDPSYKGKYTISFPRSSTVINLPPELRKLTSTPWNKLSKDIRASERVEYLDSHPAISLKVVDIDSLTVFHETSFNALPFIAELSGKDSLKGTLKSQNLRLTNRDREPAFYTSVDHMSGFMQDRSSELLLKLKIPPKKNIFLLSMTEPLSDEEKTFFLTKLTEGKKTFWTEYQAKHNKKDGTDFDLFHDAVVEVLREKYGIPVDLLMYVKDWKMNAMGREARQIYTWPVFFDRSLLQGAKLERTFYRPFSMEHSTEPGVNDNKYQEMSPALYECITKNPALHPVLTEWSSSAPFSDVWLQILGENDPFDPKWVKTERQFWDKFTGDFMKQLLSHPPADISSLTDSASLKARLTELAIEKWRTNFKNGRYRCKPTLEEMGNS